MVFSNTEITKSDKISKAKNHTKNIVYAKNERQVNFNLPYKFGHFKKKVTFLGRHLGACGAQTRYDVICKYASLRILHVEMATSEVEGGGG